jgi:L-aspartate semialdehyde sulfurtransferase ferredoxin
MIKKYTLKYAANESKRPLLSEAIIKTGVSVNILSAQMGYSGGNMVISVLADGKSQKNLVSYLSKNGLEVEDLEGNVLKDEKKCVDCCACYGVCPTKAITIDECRMVLNNDECIRCGSCVEVCPMRALKLQEIIRPLKVA